MIENNDKKEVLETAQEYMEKLIPGIYNTANLFMSGDEAKGTENMVYVVEGLHWLLDAFRLTIDIQENVIQYHELNPFLTEINDALANSDYILLADLLSYEVNPILEGWKEKNQMNIEG